jgi:outer membrane protein OmpA-like peptidoglycan-associated protein
MTTPAHHKTLFAACASFCLLLSGALSPHAVCATDMDAKRIIEALKPDASPALKTRSLRNLQVEQTGAAPAAAEVPPNVSLTIGFHFDSANLTKESVSTLSQLAQALKSNELSGLKFMVEGHTDGKGTPDYNLKLSQARASAVKTYLEKQGVEASRLVAQGKGDTELVNSQDRFAAENRRVKVITLTR